MKTNELMIGDWVNYRPGWIDEDSGKVVYESGTGFPVRVEFIYNCRGGEGLIQYNDGENDGIEAAEYELFPIPLTPEILEKNGFTDCETTKLDREMGNTFWYLGKDNFISDSALMINLMKDSFLIRFGNSTIDRLRFVHEFQHALRLCGIEKEIIL